MLTENWYFSLNSAIQYVSIKNKQDVLQKNSGFGLNGTLSTGYTITPRISSSVFLWYLQAPVTLQGSTSANYTLTWSGNYEIIKNQLSASLTLSNIFPKYFPSSGRISDPDFSSFVETKTLRRAVGFSLNWNFGKLTEHISKKRGVKNDDLLN
jgi:hypothetical protein